MITEYQKDESEENNKGIMMLIIIIFSSVYTYSLAHVISLALNGWVVLGASIIAILVYTITFQQLIKVKGKNAKWVYSILYLLVQIGTIYLKINY